MPRFRTRDEILARARDHFLYAGVLGDLGRFEDAPVLTKQRLYEGIKAALARRDPALASVYWSPSGGSTSNSKLYFPTDIQENRLARKHFGRMLVETGFFGPDTVMLNMNAGSHCYRAMELFTDYGEQAGAVVLPLGNTGTDEEALALIDEFHVNCISGPPTRLATLAGNLKAAGKKLAIETVITASDTLHESTRALIREAFGASRFQQLYGSSEGGVWAYQPASLEATGCFVFDPRMMHVEIVDPNTEGIGRIVLTPLTRFKHPVLRYDTGDVGRLEVREVDGAARQVLYFKGRGDRSFQYDADYYSLDDVERCLAGLADEYQLVIGHAPETNAETLVCRVVNLNDRKRLQQIANALVQVCPIDQVEAVRREDLVTTQPSGKVKRIVDYRA